MHRVFRLENVKGLCGILSAQTTLDESVVEISPGLWVLPAGRYQQDVVNALSQDPIRLLMEEAREKYDFVIVDSSPILPVTDGLLISQQCDGVLFAVRRDVSQLHKVARPWKNSGCWACGSSAPSPSDSTPPTATVNATRITTVTTTITTPLRHTTHELPLALSRHRLDSHAVDRHREASLGSLGRTRERHRGRGQAAANTVVVWRLAGAGWRAAAEHTRRTAGSEGDISHLLNSSGDAISIMLLCGRPGRISSHAPTVCFSGAGLRQITPEKATTIPSDAGPKREFYVATFQPPITRPGPNIVSYWSCSPDGDAWTAVNDGRLTFARCPYLYRSIITSTAASDDGEAGTPAVDAFLEEFLPMVAASLK